MNKCNADLGSRFVPQINTDIGELEALEGYCGSGLYWKYQSELVVFQI